MNYGLDPGDCLVVINGLVIDADIADPFMWVTFKLHYLHHLFLPHWS